MSLDKVRHLDDLEFIKTEEFRVLVMGLIKEKDLSLFQVAYALSLILVQMHQREDFPKEAFIEFMAASWDKS